MSIRPPSAHRSDAGEFLGVAWRLIAVLGVTVVAALIARVTMGPPLF